MRGNVNNVAAVIVENLRQDSPSRQDIALNTLHASLQSRRCCHFQVLNARAGPREMQRERVGAGGGISDPGEQIFVWCPRAAPPPLPNNGLTRQ